MITPIRSKIEAIKLIKTTLYGSITIVLCYSMGNKEAIAACLNENKEMPDL